MEGKIHLVKWEVVCTDKDKGGLGLRKLAMLNKALLGKWIWRYACDKDNLWKQVIKVKYGQEGLGWRPKKANGAVGVGVWKEIWKESEWCWDNMIFRVGKGNTIRFWTDVWCSESALSHCFPHLWGHKPSLEEDSVLWRQGRSGQFRVKEAYSLLAKSDEQAFLQEAFGWQGCQLKLLFSRGRRRGGRCLLWIDFKEEDCNFQIVASCVDVRRKCKSYPYTLYSDGQPLVASGGSSGVISIWNLEKRRLQSVIRKYEFNINIVEGERFICGFLTQVMGSSSSSLQKWAQCSSTLHKVMMVDSAFLFRDFCCIPAYLPFLILIFFFLYSFYANGRHVLSAGQDRAFRLFSVIQDQQSRELSQRHVTKRAKKLRVKEEEIKLKPVIAFDFGTILLYEQFFMH
ncbi:putative ribonuclease H protein [Vitis vinifera]|uniref:Putative ribonuclease H protein n=1 Tax=Vitis vinifera TaxID=29760 RepID=A0A438DEB0_VITVI|nr:putative ribonuclease H protein [Vitis vinifera]